MFGNDAEPVILGPNITGKISFTTQNSNYGWLPLAYTEGCFIKEQKQNGTGVKTDSSLALNDSLLALFRASSSNSIYKDKSIVQPNSLVFYYIIKY